MAAEEVMTVTLRQRWATAALAAMVAVILGAGTACGGGEKAVPTAAPPVTPVSQEDTPAPRGSSGANIAANYLVGALGPALSRGQIEELQGQAWEPAPPGQAERLLALLPETVPGMYQVFEGSFRTQGPEGEALVATRAFSGTSPDSSSIVVAVAAELQGRETASLQEWRGHGRLGEEEMATLTQAVASMFEPMGIEVQQVSQLDTGAIGEASLGLRLDLKGALAEGEEVTIDVAAARRGETVLMVSGVTPSGAPIPDVVALLREMDRKAKG